MSGLSSIKTLLPKRGATTLLLAALGASLLAGCGGGGNGNTGGNNTGGLNTGTNTGTNTGGTVGNSSVIGRVMDTQGQGVPGVSINVDSGGVLVTTLSQGGYRVDNLTGDVVHRLTAAVIRQDNVAYSGSTEVLTQNNLLVSNANIILSRADRQASVSGIVRDTNPTTSNPLGTPISGVRVSLAVPNNGNISSLTAYTDSNGAYTIYNVPIDLPSTGQITVTAAVGAVGSQTYQNQTFTLRGLQAGGGYTQDFQLNSSSRQALTAPALLSVLSFTEPTDSVSGSLRTAHAASSSAPASVYEHLRRVISPAYARVAGRRPAAGTRRVAHASGGAYAIETDVAFDNSAQPVGSSVLAFSIYRTTGAQNTPTQQQGAYDILQDPQANFYTDLTFSGDNQAYTPYAQYNFAVSAINTDTVETGLSSVFSIVPLGPLTLNQPTRNQTLANNVTLNWNFVSGAARYFVFVYDQYPTAEVQPSYATPSGTPLASTVNSFTLPGPLLTGHTYYAVVAGANDQTESTGINAGAQPIPNAAVTFSQITRFNVP